MKKFLAFLLSLTMVFAMAAVAFAEGETYLWDNFDDRDPNALSLIHISEPTRPY